MLLQTVVSPLQSFHLSHPLQYMMPYRPILFVCIFKKDICCCAFIVIQMKKKPHVPYRNPPQRKPFLQEV